MSKKLFSLLLFSLLLLTACSEKESSKPQENKAKEEATTVTLPQTSEDWLASVKKSDWYKNTSTTFSIKAEQLIDFDGDQIPEFVIGHSNEEQYGYLIGKYDSDTNSWTKWANEKFDDPYTEIVFYGKLNGENGKEMLLASHNKSTEDSLVELLKISDDNKRIIIGFRDRLSNTATISIDENENSFVEDTPGIEKIKFIVNGDHLLTDTENIGEEKIVMLTGLPLIQDEAFIALLNNSFTSLNISFNDTFKDAIAKNSEKATDDIYEGVSCKNYTDYSICKEVLDESPYSMIYQVSLFNFDQITLQDLKDTLKQDISISSYYNESDSKEWHMATFTFDHVVYRAEFDSAKPNAKLISLVIQNVATF